MSKVSEYIDNLFYLVPRTDTAAEIRQKLIESGEDKYEALLSWGKNEDEALGIVVSEFGSMEEICTELGISALDQSIPDTDLIREGNVSTRKFAFGLSAGIVICVLGLIACIVCEEIWMMESMGAIAFLLLGGIGAAVIVFSSLIYNREKKLIQSGVPVSKVEESGHDENKAIKKTADLLCSLTMLIATALFFILGIFYGKWHPAWALFPLGGIICGIISTICDGIKK